MPYDTSGPPPPPKPQQERVLRFNEKHRFVTNLEAKPGEPPPKSKWAPYKPVPPEKRKPVGRPPHVVTKQTRDAVTALVSSDCSHEEIAAHLGVALSSLRRRYKKELDPVYASTQVKTRLVLRVLQQALNGDKSSQFFLLERQFGLAKTSKHEHTGANGEPLDIRSASTSQLEQALAVLLQGTAGADDQDGAGAEVYKDQPSGLV